MKFFLKAFLALLALMITPLAFGADVSLDAIRVTTNPDGSQDYSVTMQILIIMTVLSFLPSIIIMMTSFTRIVVVMAILRQALGLQTTPSNQIIIGIARISVTSHCFQLIYTITSRHIFVKKNFGGLFNGDLSRCNCGFEKIWGCGNRRDLRRCINHRKTQAGSSSPPPRQADCGNSMIIFSWRLHSQSSPTFPAVFFYLDGMPQISVWLHH